MNILEAMARVEGFYVHGTRPNRNNNPGDLEYHPWMAKFHNAVLEDGAHPRFAKFPTPEDGWAALKALLEGHAYRGLTLEQTINRFAPGNENNTRAYVDAVCHFTGLQPSDVIDPHLGA
jgi:hypothetical protein